MEPNQSMMVDIQKDSSEMQSVLHSSLFRGPVDVDYADPSYLLSPTYQAQAYPLYDLVSPATGSTSSSSSFGGDNLDDSAHLFQSQGAIYPPQQQSSGQQIVFANFISPEMTSLVSSNSSTSSSSVDERYTRSTAATYPPSMPTSSTFDTGDNPRPDGRYNVRQQSGVDGGQSAAIHFGSRASISQVMPGYHYQPAPVCLEPALRERNHIPDVHPYEIPQANSLSHTVSPIVDTPHQSPFADIEATTSRPSSTDDNQGPNTQTKQAEPESALSSPSPVKIIQQRRSRPAAISGPPAASSVGTKSQQITDMPREWSQEDLLALVHVLNEVKGRSWIEIAKRSFPDGKFVADECREKWKELSKEKKAVNRGPWSQQEDQALLDAVSVLGPEKWVVIATQVGDRNGKQCRERWHNHLSPDIKKGKFTAEEDEIIFHWYSIVGSKWSEIAKHLPGRPDNMIKNHFNNSVQRQKRRLRHIEKASAGSLKRERSASFSAREEESVTGPRSLEDRFEAMVKNMHPTSRSVSSQFESIMNSPTSGPSGTLSMAGLGLGLSYSTAKGMNGPESGSADGMPQHRSPTSVQYFSRYPDEYANSPLTFAHTLPSVGMLASPSMPSRHTYAPSRFAYHPYSCSVPAPSRSDYHHQLGKMANLISNAGYTEPAHLTPPATPEKSSLTGSYAVYGPPDAREPSSTAAVGPASAPWARETFPIYPTTPARRATVAEISSEQQYQGSRSGYYSQQPFISATYSQPKPTNFGQKAFTLPVDYGAPQSQGQDFGLSRFSDPNSPMKPCANFAVMLSSTLTNPSNSPPVVGQELISPRPSASVNAGRLESCAAAQERALATPHGQTIGEPDHHDFDYPNALRSEMYSMANPQEAYYAMMSNSASRPCADNNGCLTSPMTSPQMTNFRQGTVYKPTSRRTIFANPITLPSSQEVGLGEKGGPGAYLYQVGAEQVTTYVNIASNDDVGPCYEPVAFNGNIQTNHTHSRAGLGVIRSTSNLS